MNSPEIIAAIPGPDLRSLRGAAAALRYIDRETRRRGQRTPEDDEMGREFQRVAAWLDAVAGAVERAGEAGGARD